MRHQRGDDARALVQLARALGAVHQADRARAVHLRQRGRDEAVYFEHEKGQARDDAGHNTDLEYDEEGIREVVEDQAPF